MELAAVGGESKGIKGRGGRFEKAIKVTHVLSHASCYRKRGMFYSQREGLPTLEGNGRGVLNGQDSRLDLGL